MKQSKAIICLIFLMLYPCYALADKGFIIELTDGEVIRAKSFKEVNNSINYTNILGYPGFLSVENVVKIFEVNDLEIYASPTIKKQSNLRPDGPKCTQDDMWKFVINNAYRIADEYAISRNPSSTFISKKKDYHFVKQYGGEYEGNYLLMITNKHGGNTSFAVLLPLFDINMPSENLDDNKPLWKVVSTKLNGRSY